MMQSGLPIFVSQLVSMGVWLSVCFCPVLLLFLLQLVVSFCRCWTSQLSHRFKHTSIFEKATHVLGVVDFLVIKTLAMDWKVEAESWIEVTSRQLNEVRPQLGSRMVSTDVTSPSKLKNSFIVMWFFSLFDPAGIKYKICRNLQISFSLFHPAGIKYKFADFISK